MSQEFDLFGNAIAPPPARAPRAKAPKPKATPAAPPRPTQAEIAAEKQRLNRNAQAVLDRLKQGPATNVELATVGGNRFGARLFELRKAGHPIKLVGKDGGITTYQLETP